MGEICRVAVRFRPQQLERGGVDGESKSNEVERGAKAVVLPLHQRLQLISAQQASQQESKADGAKGHLSSRQARKQALRQLKKEGCWFGA